MNYSVLLTFYLLHILSTLALTSIKKRSFNAYPKWIFCPNDLPDLYVFRNFLWDPLDFTDLANLCSAWGNPRGNMGGFCAPALRPGDPSLKLEPVFYNKLAREANLWNAALENYCREKCHCANDEDEYYQASLLERIYNLDIKDLEKPGETLPNAAAPTQTSGPGPEDW
ncbi:hypothetical protein MMC17_006297 [Xylographa soralifera]|nr:hypothetical protein [Xylographa soralifera]